MNDKITIQDLIELLAEKHSMTKKDAETFVKGMFELIEEALATEKYVKVKGLGTFKLIEVESRESVNVNTGERIEIQGHTKISFTPDSGMKDLINKPFAHFETVILNENTMLEDTETEFEGEAERADNIEEVTSEKIKETVINEAIAQTKTDETGITKEKETHVIASETERKHIETENAEVEKFVFVDKEEVVIATEESVIEESITSTEKEIQIIETEVSQEEAITLIEETIAEETISAVKETTLEKRPQEQEEIMTIADAAMLAAREGKTLSEITSEDRLQKEEKNIAETSPKIEMTDKEKPQTRRVEKKTRISWGIIIAVVIFIVCIAGGIYWYFQCNKKDSIPQTTVATLQEGVNENISMQTQDSTFQKHDSLEVIAAIDASEKTIDYQPQQRTPIPQKMDMSTDRKDVAKVTLADTVEYDITGTKTNYTLQEGESLIKVAMKFYGTKKLWPYIVKHNKNIIKDADRVPIGTTLRIPELTPKKQ